MSAAWSGRPLLGRAAAMVSVCCDVCGAGHGTNVSWGPELHVAPPKKHLLLTAETTSVQRPAPRGSGPRGDGDGQ